MKMKFDMRVSLEVAKKGTGETWDSKCTSDIDCLIPTD